MTPEPLYNYLALLDRVVDGDTVDITIDLGFRVTTKQRVRLLGIDAPERNTSEGQASIKFVQDWFLAHRGPYTIASEKPGGGDKFGRYLATIYADATRKVCLNDDLVSSGHAKVWGGQGAKPV